MRRKRATNADVARIATQQHGVITLAQLPGVGLSSAAVTRRVQTGRLFRVHRGVYAVRHTALGNEGRWMAAVLASGKGAVLSHRSAAELWAMLPARGGPVDITIASASGRAKKRSDLERGFLRLCRRHRLPMPEVNVPIGPYTADFLWRERGLIVETDGWQAHRGRQAFEGDRLRALATFLRPAKESRHALGRVELELLIADPDLVARLEARRAKRGQDAYLAQALLEIGERLGVRQVVAPHE